MSIFGAGPQFWEGIAGFTRKMLSPYLRKMPARVQSVQGTAPNQTAVVARADELAALAAGEISEIARPSYPVWGSVVAGQQVWCLVDGAGLHVMGTPGSAGGGGSTSDLLGAKNAAEALSTYPAGNTIAFGDATTTGWPVTHVLVVTDNRTPFRNHQVIVEQPSGRTWRRVWDPALASGAGAWTAFGELPGVADKAKLDGLGPTVGGFSVYRSVAQLNLINLESTKVLFDAKQWDDANWFNATNSRYAPQRAGRYSLNASVRVIGTAGNARLALMLFKNGILLLYLSHQHTSGSAQPMNISGTAIVEANGTTDYFEVFVFHNFGASTADIEEGSTSTYFQGYKLP